MKRINEHLIHGFTYTFPLIVLFSISLAIDQNLVSLGKLPDWIFLLIIPVLTMTIASSVTSKILVIPGLVLGYLMNDVGMGFFGGILGGLLLGYVGLMIASKIQFKRPWAAVVGGYLLAGGLAFVISFLIMNYLVSIPIVWFMDIIRTWIEAIDPTETILLVGVLALFTVVDLGGPFNKVAFTFVLEFYADGLYHITGPAIISVAIPPLSMLAVVFLYKNRIKRPEKQTIRLLLFGGLFGLTESAIPIVLEDPLRRLPVIALGSVLASTFAAWQGLSNILMMVSVPGLFGTNNILMYLIAHLIGVGTIVLLVGILTPRKQLQDQQNTI